MVRPSKVNRVRYSQFLLATQTNYTLTYMSEHLRDVSHDAINHYLLRDKLSPSKLWEHVKQDIEYSPNGVIVYDDTVLDKSHSNYIELVRWQYSGNERKVIRGIGVVTCIYYNPDKEKFWAIDYRIYAPEADGKGKVEHVKDMLFGAIYSKYIQFGAVLMDTWYASNKLMQFIDTLGKKFFCTIRRNRLLSRVDQKHSYCAAAKLELSKEDVERGVEMHLHKGRKDFNVKLFRITVKPHRTEHIITNDLAQSQVEAVQKVYGFRNVIEQLHREVKQTTGIEHCECRKQRIQRNHIACAFLVWAHLKRLSYKLAKATVYSIKQNLLHNYLSHHLRSPNAYLRLA